jgi:hypothetical protein
MTNFNISETNCQYTPRATLAMLGLKLEELHLFEPIKQGYIFIRRSLSTGRLLNCMRLLSLF